MASPTVNFRVTSADSLMRPSLKPAGGMSWCAYYGEKEVTPATTIERLG